MTKEEFKHDAYKAGIPAELYGATLIGGMYDENGSIASGKVVGIVWRLEWISLSPEFRPVPGHYEEVPFVVLQKDSIKYKVRVYYVKEYIEEACLAWLGEQVKANIPI